MPSRLSCEKLWVVDRLLIASEWPKGEMLTFTSRKLSSRKSAVAVVRIEVKNLTRFLEFETYLSGKEYRRICECPMRHSLFHLTEHEAKIVWQAEMYPMGTSATQVEVVEKKRRQGAGGRNHAPVEVATDKSFESVACKSKARNTDETTTTEQVSTIVQFAGRWYLRYWEKRVEHGVLVRKRMSHLLGPAEGRERIHPPDDIERAAERWMSNNVHHSAIQPEHVTTLSDFVETVYLPWFKQFKRPATAKSYEDIWQDHLKPVTSRYRK